MNSSIFLFVSFLALSSAQSFTYLKDLKGNHTINTVYGKSDKSSLYVTASSDDPNLLKQIIFTNGANNISAYELTQRRDVQGSDLVTRWVVDGITTMQTSLPTDVLLNLTGGVYFTTSNQATSKFFRVYDVSQNQQVIINDTLGHTIVFINSLHSGYPKTPTTIKNWEQPSWMTVYIYNGVPTDYDQVQNTQIFSNPVYSQQSVFFNSVEDFSITIPAFFIRAYTTNTKGSFTFTTSPDYVNIDNSTTKAYNTTGFYMKSAVDLPKTVSILPVRNDGFLSSTGINSIANIQTSGEILFKNYEGSDLTTTKIFNASKTITRQFINEVGTKLEISSENCETGQFYIQYYFIRSNSPVVVTTETSTSHQSTQTTASSSSTKPSPAHQSTQSTQPTSSPSSTTPLPVHQSTKLTQSTAKPVRTTPVHQSTLSTQSVTNPTTTTISPDHQSTTTNSVTPPPSHQSTQSTQSNTIPDTTIETSTKSAGTIRIGSLVLSLIYFRFFI